MSQAPKKSIFNTVRSVSTDPGVGWSLIDLLIFAGTNTLGMLAMGTSTVVAAACKALSVSKPAFLERNPKLAAVVKDERTPLRTGGVASIIVTAATALTGLWLPAITGTFFALGYFKTANSLSQAQSGTTDIAADEKLPLWKRALKLTFKRPDFYVATGMMLAGLMAGGASLWALPLVAAGFAVSMKNVLQSKPEHMSHPKLAFSAASLAFSAVGIATGAYVIGIAHFLNSGVMLKIESDITPGGIKQIWKDIRNGAASLFGRKTQGCVTHEKAPPAKTANIPKAQAFKQGHKLSSGFKSAIKRNGEIAQKRSGYKTAIRPKRL